MNYPNDYERNLYFRLNNTQDKEKITKIGKALSVPERIEILMLINSRAMNVVEISKTLNIPISSTAFHIKALEAANLIMTKNAPGIKGHMRLCSRLSTSIYLELWNSQMASESKYKVFTIEMPIGTFVDFAATPTCGIANELRIIEMEDSPRVFYSPERIKAQLIWMQTGYLVYRFPNYFIDENNPLEISFSFEICSETAYYRNEWPSDITVWINNIEIATYTSPGKNRY